MAHTEYHSSWGNQGGACPPCFAAGTRLAAVNGDIAIEDLREGDLVVTGAGEMKPIVWVGRSPVDCRRHPHPEQVRPVRVRASAFAPGVPIRDLWLSPDHSIYARGVLIPVKYLVNGATIAQEHRDHVTYFHAELAQHDILLAEGLPVESYLDTGNRNQFANGGSVAALYPDFAAKSWNDAFAPLRTEGDELRSVRRQLLTRVEELGYRRRDTSDLHVVVGERVLRAARVRGRLHQFLIFAGNRSAKVISNAGVPAGHDLAVADCRQLGVCIGGIMIDGRVVPLDSGVFGSGFHSPENNGRECWRWTDGVAELSLPESAEPFILEILVQDTMRWWEPPVSTPQWSAAAA